MFGKVFRFCLIVLLPVHFVYSDTATGIHESGTKRENNVDINGMQKLFNFGQEKSSIENGPINNVDIDEYYTFYDKIFWLFLSSFIGYIIYIRAITHFRIDYPEEKLSPFMSAILSYRKIIAPDPYLDAEMKTLDEMTSFENAPLIAFWILLYCVSLFSLDEVFGINNKRIEDLGELIVALFIYFINILGICIVFDICVSAPMKYYEE